MTQFSHENVNKCSPQFANVQHHPALFGIHAHFLPFLSVETGRESAGQFSVRLSKQQVGCQVMNCITVRPRVLDACTGLINDNEMTAIILSFQASVLKRYSHDSVDVALSLYGLYGKASESYNGWFTRGITRTAAL